MVVEEVLCILHRLLNFNSTEIISHSPFWAGCLHLCQWESPDLECEHSRKMVFPSVLLDRVQICSTLSLVQTGFSVFLYSFNFFHFLWLPSPHKPYPYSSMNNFFLACFLWNKCHKEVPWKDLSFCILIISVCGCLHRNCQSQKERSRQVMMDRALLLCHCLGLITSCLVSLKILMPCRVELAVHKHWSVSLFLSAQQHKSMIQNMFSQCL